MTSSPPDLVVIGDCNPDVLVLGGDVTPAFGQQEKLVESMSLVIGGSASITAVAEARLGLRVALVAAVGADPGLAAVLSAAREAGATTSLDTNWDPSGRWGDDRLAAAMAQADVLLPNEAEALRLSGQADLATAARALGAAGSRLVVKLGERGALCAGGAGRRRVSLPPVVPVDTTGAGDCFNAGLIAGLLDGLALPQAAALGCAVGALSTRAAGGTASCPDLASAVTLAQAASITRP